MNRTRIASLVGAAALALSVTAAMGLPAQAKDGGTESAHGSCSADSTWKLNATGHGDNIKIKAKVATGVAGETWTYSISDNGTEVAAGDATTNKDGKLKAKVLTANLDGTDTIDATATNTVTGETCAGEVVFDK